MPSAYAKPSVRDQHIIFQPSSLNTDAVLLHCIRSTTKVPAQHPRRRCNRSLWDGKRGWSTQNLQRLACCKYSTCAASTTFFVSAASFSCRRVTTNTLYVHLRDALLAPSKEHHALDFGRRHSGTPNEQVSEERQRREVPLRPAARGARARHGDLVLLY